MTEPTSQGQPADRSIHRATTVMGGQAHGPQPPGEPTAIEGFDLARAQALVGSRYRVERLAGEGGMGRVLQATDTVLSRRVGIKLLHNVRGDGDDHARRTLLSEARAMAGLNHPNIVRVLEISLEGQPAQGGGRGVPFIVMEWIDGVPLATAWRGLALQERVSLLLKIVDGVAAAHAAGLVHGDLKPANVLLDRAGQPVIVDFGLARGGQHEAPTQVAAVAATGGGQARGRISGGTPGYAAPEQFDAGGPVGPWSDVYALGVMLFELLTGRVPFLAGTTAETLRLQRESDPPLPEQLAPESPVALQRICLVALERDPWRRFKDAGELAQDLRRFMRGETVTARPSMLAARFVDQVQEQIDRAGQWRKLGLVTEAEHRAMTRTLRTVLRPDSPWLIDSRRLTASQVSLYLGGWLVILGLSVGVFRAWDVMPDWSRIAAPAALTAILCGTGVWLLGRGFQRTGLAYLITASLAAPIAALLIFKHTSWLGTNANLGQELLAQGYSTLRPPPQGLYNAQLFACAGVWLLVASGLRWRVLSSAFTFLAAIAWACLAVSAWLVTGGYHREGDAGVWAALGAWLSGFAVAALGAGLALSGREERDAARLGLHNLRRADAWPLLTVGTALFFVGLTLIAWNKPRGLIVPDWLAGDDAPGAVVRSLGLIVSGLALFALSVLLGRGRSAAREHLASALRWVLPSHFLGPLVVFHNESFWGVQWLWIVLLAAGAVVLVYSSVLRQWKPFLVNGLVYFMVAYLRAFDQVTADSDDPVAKVWMMAGMVGLGLAFMVLAWLGPVWLAGARGRWWMVAARKRMAQLTRTNSRPPDAPIM